jgi:RNA-directed DNA polymerase
VGRENEPRKALRRGGRRGCVQAEGEPGRPRRVDVVVPAPPGSKSSARVQIPHVREPRGLDVASPPGVGGRQAREGTQPHAVSKSIEESDEAVVPENRAKTVVTPVERVEGRAEAEGKAIAGNALPTQGGAGALTYLRWLGERAKKKDKEQFTNLHSHLKVALLKEAYQRLRRTAAAGVDEVTWHAYGERLDERLRELQDRVQRGSYYPPPVRRVHIPKGDGRTRPLGIPALEDKVVQQAVGMLLQPIYEAEFLGFSYGFRPGRSQHGALDALATAIDRKVNWVLDADIRSFFDTLDHEWLRKFVGHRIGDTRLLRLIAKWLKAGVMEDGQLHEVTEGTPQGGVISPLLANVYLHYVLDLWFQQWRKRHARGEVYIVRYADDFVVGLQYEQDAVALRTALAERLADFGLELHPEKTRVLEFGQRAREERARRGEGKPETFDFLGFTHIASTDRRGRFQLKRFTRGKKIRAKLSELNAEIKWRRHEPVHAQHAWLVRVLVGHYRYYGVPTNARRLQNFRDEVQRRWHWALQRRSQRARWNLEDTAAFKKRYPLPPAQIHHPWPEKRFLRR